MTQSNGSKRGLAFDLEWRLTLFTVVLLPLLVSLGFWQLSRAEEKTALEARHAARSALPATNPQSLMALPAVERADRQLRFEASFSQDGYLLIDNRVQGGRVGFEVLALMRSGDLLVPVNLGWIAGDPARRKLPDVALAEGELEIRGRAYVPSGEAYLLDDEDFPAATPAVIQAFPVSRWAADIAAATGLAVFPHEVRIAPSSPYAMSAKWPVVNQSAAKHTGYAVQWFTMAAVLLLAYLLRSTNLWSLIRGREAED